ncbi:MAG: glycosyltransferase family 4 protein [Ardenticatenaceae bacterium]|nr:glycosyltransferase family 4 protein [Ardenticatenaceae bacterium]
MPLKIGLVTGEYPPMEGGVGAFTQELAKELAVLGHQVHIITSRQARPAAEERRIANLLEPVDIGFAQLHPQIQKWRWPSLAAVADVVLRYGLDVVNIQYQAAAYHMGSPAANFLPWRLRGLVKTAVTFHDLRVPYLFPKAGRLRETAVTFMARQADGCITTNLADYEELRTRVQTAVVQIPIGSNITTYQPHHVEIAEARERLGLQDGDRLLGYFGFLNESKGADTLLESLAQLEDNIHLVFIGGQTGSSDSDNNQSFLAQLKQRIEAMGLAERVHWTGFLPDQRVSTFLHAADVMVMPYRDGVSLRRGTLMAVLAHGRPLITTHPAMPAPELVHGENCWLVSTNDSEAVSCSVHQLLDDYWLCEKIGGGAAQVARLFTWDKIAVQTADFLQTLKVKG